MWKCTSCNKENQDSDSLCQCGFDRSIDYEKLRTFVKLDIHDFQNFQKMQVTVRSNINLESEEQKDFVENGQEEEENKEKKILTNTDSVLLKKTVFPKTKLEWLIFGIGIVILCGFICGNSLPTIHYFTGYSFCEPIGDIFYFLSDGFLKYLVVIICYIVMYKSLRAIQYDKNKKQILLYVLSSVLPMCCLGDVVWGRIISSASMAQQYYFVKHKEILSFSWFVVYLGIPLFALIEKPEKVIAKNKERNEKCKTRRMSIFPQTKLQTLVLAMGIALVVLFMNQEVWAYNILNIKQIQITTFVSWNLLYWLGKCMRNAPKKSKVLMYALCSFIPLLTFYNAMCNIPQLSSYVGESMGVVECFLFAIWIWILIMAVKEEQTN